MQRINLRFRTSVTVFVLLLLTLCITTCLGQDSSLEQDSSMKQLNLIKGTWVLKSIYQTQNVEGPSVSEQKKLLGTSITLDGGVLKACGQSVPVKSITVIEVSSDDFLTNTLARFNDVGVDTTSIKEVVINGRQSGTCFGAFPIPGQDVYIKSRDELLIDFEGVFYRAVRKK